MATPVTRLTTPYALHVIRKDFAYNTPHITTSSGISIGKMPRGSIVTEVFVTIRTGFDGEADNEIRVDHDMAAPRFVTPCGSQTLMLATDGVMGDLDGVAAPEDQEWFVMYSYTGAPPTAGNASVIITFCVDPTPPAS